METWVIANQKGGVGKTTTTLTLSALLASRGKKVLMVDLDPHASLTAYLKFDPDTAEGSVYEVFLSGHSINKNIKQTDIDNLYLLSASPALATLDRQLGTQHCAKEGLVAIGYGSGLRVGRLPADLGDLNGKCIGCGGFFNYTCADRIPGAEGLRAHEEHPGDDYPGEKNYHTNIDCAQPV